MDNNVREEKDTMGIVQVPMSRYWGAQTQRSLKYFNISNEKIPKELIISLAKIKLAAARVNGKLGLINDKLSNAIICSAQEIISGKLSMLEFPLSVWQTGSGTQTNMNINEVIANRSSEILEGEKGKNRKVHPNDDVNKNQSSNDVFPTAMHISAVVMIKDLLLPALNELKNTLKYKSKIFSKVIKIGRTHLQDAIPMTVGQEISGWLFMLKHNINQIKKCLFRLYELAIGGTAVGTGYDSHPEYSLRIVKEIIKITGLPFVSAVNKFEALSTCDSLVYAHGSLKSLSASIMKIANDIRLLSSGPRCGIGELIIPGNEPGSSIMPGKINPTQCESISMICCQIFGNDVSINIGGSSGNLQLNVFRPMIIYNFLQSVKLLSDGIKNFNRYCVSGLELNYNRINYYLNNSLMLATALKKYIGYDKSSEVVIKAQKENLTLKESAIKLGYISSQEFDKLVDFECMVNN